MRAALLALALAGCDRGCGASRPSGPPSPSILDAPARPTVVLPARCVPEITRAAVAAPLGTGAIDTITAACSAGRLAVYVLRGHVLSRAERALTAGAAFGPVTQVSTGADRLGPVPPTGVDGPLAWRSPTTGADDERDEVWVGAGGDPPRRGSVLLPPGVVGLGAPFPVGADARGVTVLAGVAREGVAPGALWRRVEARRDDREALAAPPPLALEGEPVAWEFGHGVALARVYGPPGAPSELAAYRLAGRAFRRVGSVTARAGHVLVVPRGAQLGAASLFVAGEFALGDPDGGRCVTVGAGLCVRPGRTFLVRVEGESVARLDLTDDALPDAVAPAGDVLVALQVRLGRGGAHQEAARVDPRTGRVTALALAPPEGMPDIDRPTLVPCPDGPWLVAEVALPRGDGGGSVAVTALPLECLAR